MNDGSHRVEAKARIVVEKNGNRLEMEDEVIQFEPNRLLALRITGSMFELTNRYEINEVGDETHLRQTLQTNYKDLVRVFVPFMGNAVKQKLDEDLERLKKIVEAK